MTAQEMAAYGLVALAALFLAVRTVRRRRSANCCGENECPAAKAVVDKIRR